MEITSLGHSSFRIKGKNATLITDPFDPNVVGMEYASVTADVVTVSHLHKDHDYTKGIEGNPVVVSGPGEYEIKGVKICGLLTYHDAVKGQERGKNTIYQIDIDGVLIVHCGDLGHKLEEMDREQLNGCDILMIPVGGTYTISAHVASEVVAQLEPSIIIPMHFKTDKLNPKMFEKLTAVSEFLKEMGKESIIPQSKLNITKDKIPSEPTVVVLG